MTACNVCVHFDHSSTSPITGDALCRRFPPQRHFDPVTGKDRSRFPVVKKTDWCGEFERREEEPCNDVTTTPAPAPASSE